MVVRAGSIALPDQAGALRADDYAYFLAPPGRVYRLDWLFAAGQDAAEAEREMFGTFALAGDVPLGELAEFYDLPIPARHHPRTAAQLFDNRFDCNPQTGYRLTLGAPMKHGITRCRDRVCQEVSISGDAVEYKK